MIPPPPAQLRIEQRQGYCVVKSGEDVVAQGTERMCELVAARRSIFIESGDLFDHA